MKKIKTIDIWEQERDGEYSSVEGELRLALSDIEKCGFNEVEIVSNCIINVSTNNNSQFAMYTHAVIIKKDGNPERIVLYYKNTNDFEQRAKKVLCEFGIKNTNVCDCGQVMSEPIEEEKQNVILSACSPNLASAFARAAADDSCESEFLDKIVGWSLHPYGEMIVSGNLGNYQLEIEHKGICQLVCKNEKYLIALQKESNADWKDILKTMVRMTFENTNTPAEIEKIISTKFSGLSEFDDYTWGKPAMSNTDKENSL